MRLICAFVAAVLCGGPGEAAQVAAGNPLSGPVVKAVFLLNFARFTEWPPRQPEGPLTLCVLGDPQIASLLDKLVGDRAINGRDVAVARIETLRIVRSCQLLYVSSEDPARVTAALDEVSARQVFTVGEGDVFARSGGIATLFSEDGRTRFAINADALNRAGLRVSSQMMGLARLVRGQR